VSCRLASIGVVSVLIPICAPACALGDQGFEAERMQVARVNGHVVHDASASARHALILFGRGSARARVRVRATSRVTVVVRADACGGAPRLVVALDGGRARSARVTTHRWTGAAIRQTIAPGMHRIALRLANPHRSTRCRRDLRVDRLVFVFAAPPAAPGGGGGTPQPPVTDRWVPGARTTWQWQLTTPVDQSVDAEMFDIDLFDNPASVVAALHARGRHVA
jgi:Glycoside-hydrolase family GH114